MFIHFFIACVLALIFLPNSLGNTSEANRKPLEKIIVLTFDDGPRPRVLKNLLPLLKKHDVPATFFVIGANAGDNAELLWNMNIAGHEIENHGYGHENFKKLMKEKGVNAVKTSVEKTDEMIWEITGRKPCFFRPPFWEITDEIEKNIIPLGYIVMKLNDPDINTMDYTDTLKSRPANALVDGVKKIVLNREKLGKSIHILVFHELPITIKALETLIPYFKKNGYKFARLDDLGYREREAAK